MRVGDFVPVEVKGRKRKWRVNIPATLSPTGKRQQLFFKTKLEAEDALLAFKHQRKSFGNLLEEISQHDLSEAVRAIELLRPHGIGLLQAATEFLGNYQQRKQSKTFGEIFDAFEKLRANKSADYQTEIKHTRAKVLPLLDRPIVDVAASDLEACLSDCADSTRNLRIKNLRSVFSHAVRKGWTPSNAADQLDTVTIQKGEVQIHAVDEVERMLRCALESDPSLVPFLGIAAFCGLRPENELFNLEWQDVHLDGNPQIVVRPATSKTSQRRFVDISPNCLRWISASKVQTTGRVVPFSFTTLTRKRKANSQRAGVKTIPDGLRHTYASAWLAKHLDVNVLVRQMGHRSPNTTFRHYHRTMSAADAEKYWNIVPSI